MEQGERLDSTLMPQGQDVEHSTDDNAALDAAATRLLTAPPQPLSVAAAIEGHRAAREALNAACPAQDEVALSADGRDTSDEAMAPARAAWKAADEREVEAFEALLSCRPTDPAGLAQMLAYVAESPALGDLDDSTDALRNIAAAAANVAMDDARSSVSPAVMLAASEAWNAYVAIRKADKEWAAEQITERAWKSVYERAHETLDRLSMVEAKTWLDMACKCLALGAEEAWELNTSDDPAEDGRIKRIGRQFETMILAGGQADCPAPTPAVADPIFPLIAEGRRLLCASETLHARPEADTPEGETAAELERTAALRALWDHNSDRLLKTVPLTAAGCRELSRFAVEYFERNEVPISYDEQAVTGLIARSPLLTADVDQEDLALLSLGRKLDEAHAIWRRAVEAYRDADEQHTAFLEAAKARGGPTMAEIIEGEKIPGYKDGCKADENAFGIAGDIALEILKHRPRSIAGLGVLARALVPLVWPTGSFEEDAALAPDEDMDREAVRHMVEACCAAAGIDWRGDTIEGACRAPASGVGGADPIGGDPAISGMAADLWQASISLRQAEDDLMAERIPEKEWEPYHEAVIGLIEKLSDAPAKSIQDMAYKSLALAVMEAWEVGFNDDPADDNRRRRIGRQFDEMVVSGMSPRAGIRVRPAASLGRSGVQASAAAQDDERPLTIPSAPTAASFIRARLVEMNGIADEWWEVHDAAGRAADAAEMASDQTAEGMAELASTHAIRILRENLLRATNLPATTVGELGLQARLIAVELNERWSSQSLSQGEKACRTLIDRLMGLAGIAPINRADVSPAEVRDWLANPIPHAARIIPDMPEARS